MYAINKTYVVGSNGASGVASDEFELHIDPSKQILFLGLKSGARDLVERQREKLPSAVNLGAVAAPSEVEILVEVASICYSASASNPNKNKKQ